MQVIQPGRPTKTVKGPDGKDEIICTTWKGMPQDIRASPDGKRVLRRRHDGRRRATSSTARRSGRSASSRPARARTGSIRAATARSSTSPTAARTRSTDRRRARAACRSSTSRRARSTSTWPIPGGGSPDMGNVSADGKRLWLSGRYDNVVYVFDTTTGAVQDHPGRQGAARAHRVAAAGPLFARPHRQHALMRSCATRRCTMPSQPRSGDARAEARARRERYHLDDVG